jgi:hypothetical protein
VLVEDLRYPDALSTQIGRLWGESTHVHRQPRQSTRLGVRPLVRPQVCLDHRVHIIERYCTGEQEDAVELVEPSALVGNARVLERNAHRVFEHRREGRCDSGSHLGRRDSENKEGRDGRSHDGEKIELHDALESTLMSVEVEMADVAASSTRCRVELKNHLFICGSYLYLWWRGLGSQTRSTMPAMITAQLRQRWRKTALEADVCAVPSHAVDDHMVCLGEVRD